jgi:hypothetical protein
MKLNEMYRGRIHTEIKEDEKRIIIQEQKKSDAIEASQVDIRQNIEDGRPAVPFPSTIEHIKEIENKIEELRNHISYLNNVLEKGEL